MIIQFFHVVLSTGPSEILAAAIARLISSVMMSRCQKHSLKMMVECEGTLHILHNDDWVSTTSVFKTTLIYMFISGQITIRNKILFYVVKP